MNILCPALLVACALVVHAQEHDSLSRRVHFAVSLVGGADYSGIESTGDMAVFFEPLPDRSVNLKSPAFGIQGDLLIGRVFGAMLGLGYDRRGMCVYPTTVEFKDDPFEHDFEAHMVASYVTLTLAVKAGYRAKRQWVNVVFGLEPAFVWSDSLYWQIDGKPASVPNVEADGDVRLLAGIEYGFRHKWFGVFATVGYSRGTTDMAWGYEGDTRAKTFYGRLGVRYFFGARQP